MRAYGVDCNTIHLLLAVGDIERATALCKPFLAVPQFWCDTLFIVADRGGGFDFDDVYEDLETHHPGRAQSVCESFSYFKKGDVVPEPTADSQPWIAWLLVFSREPQRFAAKGCADSSIGPVRAEVVWVGATGIKKSLVVPQA